LVDEPGLPTALGTLLGLQCPLQVNDDTKSARCTVSCRPSVACPAVILESPLVYMHMRLAYRRHCVVDVRFVRHGHQHRRHRLRALKSGARYHALDKAPVLGAPERLRSKSPRGLIVPVGLRFSSIADRVCQRQVHAGQGPMGSADDFTIPVGVARLKNVSVL
jgi:hypothetical protein